MRLLLLRLMMMMMMIIDADDDDDDDDVDDDDDDGDADDDDDDDDDDDGGGGGGGDEDDDEHSGEQKTTQNSGFFENLQRFEAPTCQAVLRSLKIALQGWRPTGIHARNFPEYRRAVGASNLSGPHTPKFVGFFLLRAVLFDFFATDCMMETSW